MPEPLYVRFQSSLPNKRGIYPGVFSLVNRLAFDLKLSAGEERFRVESNAWYDANFLDPAMVDPAVYNRDVNPGAAAWFKSSARHLIDRVAGYLAILDAHDIACVRLESPDPGRVIYEDPDQIVVVPYEITA
ncbi:hypothetical protein [Nonomuraea sediminis]|uniref:hypothetical protein n=1 Tax=Nonomuraea sediminis TaxID=2835864 RepID=UPI001BDCD7A1|nr:hypothetical protein [Nonomuraea sediminis]